MATKTNVDVSGLRELGEKMRGLSEKVNKQIAGRATGKGAGVVRKLAKIKAPVDTGSLRDAIIAKKLGKSETRDTAAHIVTVRVRGSRRKSKGKAKRVQPTAPHASLLEFGTIKMRARPYLRPAFDEGKDKALDAIKQTLSDGITAATK